MKFFYSLLLLIICVPLLSAGVNNPPPFFLVPDERGKSDSTFLVGEDLTYEVSWMGISLGTVRSVVVRQQEANGKRTTTATGYIDSYAGVPFVDLHAIFETTMNDNGIPLSFSGVQKEEEKWEIAQYQFDQQAHRLIVRESVADSKTGEGAIVRRIDTAKIGNNSLDGLSLLFFARLNVRSRQQPTMPTIINGEQGATYINFYGKHTSTDIDAVDYSVDVIEFDGEAKFSGIFGLSGPFKGWFSNDGANIPIKAKMKVILGSITIELIKWRRAGWSPPMSTEE